MRLCVICKSEIDEERANGMPDTRLCMEHGKQIQDFGGEFRMTATADRTSKQGSLKLNYGGVSTEKVRNDDGIELLRDRYERERFEE